MPTREVRAVAQAARRQVQGAVRPRAAAVGDGADVHRARHADQHRAESRSRRDGLRRPGRASARLPGRRLQRRRRRRQRRHSTITAARTSRARVFSLPFKNVEERHVQAARRGRRGHRRQPARHADAAEPADVQDRRAADVVPLSVGRHGGGNVAGRRRHWRVGPQAYYYVGSVGFLTEYLRRAASACGAERHARPTCRRRPGRSPASRRADRREGIRTGASCRPGTTSIGRTADGAGSS